MAFFLIVPSVMIVSIFLIHGIAERFKLNIKYRSLFLCAVMSIVLNLVAIKLSAYLDEMFYIRLGALILISSIIITFVNRFLVKREKSKAEILTYTTNELKTNINDTDDEEIIEPDDVVEPVIKELSIIKVPEPIVSNEPVSMVKVTKSKSVDKPVELQQETPKPVKIVESSEVKVVPAVDKPIINKTTEIIDKKVDKEVKVDKPVEIKKPVETEKTVKAVNSLKTANAKISAVIDKTSIKADKKPSPAVVNKDEIDEISVHLGSLDDILDYAYAEKSQGHLRQAIIAYQKALDRYKNDEYAPFIAIDLGNIYKEQAAYTKAIKTYEEALNLPYVVRSAATHREFTKNIAYLRIVQTVLAKHRALSTPFSRISHQHMQEIESEFQLAQLKSAHSRAGV